MNLAMAILITAILFPGCMSLAHREDACADMLAQARANEKAIRLLAESQTKAIKDSYAHNQASMDGITKAMHDMANAERDRKTVIVQSCPVPLYPGREGTP